MNRRELFAVAAGAVAISAAPAAKPHVGPFSVFTSKGLYVSDGKGPWPHPPEVQRLIDSGQVHPGGIVNVRMIDPDIAEIDQGGRKSYAIAPRGNLDFTKVRST